MPQSCPICLQSALRELSHQRWSYFGQDFRLQKCAQCGSAMTSPRPSDQVLSMVYGGSFDYRWYQDHYEAKLDDCRIRIREYAERLGQRVLDFGGGVGYFSEAVRDSGRESVTYDPYARGGVRPAGMWDTVVGLHVLEHSNDLDRIISEIKGLLAPGGRIILAVPNYSSVGYQKMGMEWVWAQPPLIHVFHFTAQGLKVLLERHGFVNLEFSFHERWDANTYCDVIHAGRYRRWDRQWAMRPFRYFAPFRKWIARRNARLRFEGLREAECLRNDADEALSELEVTAILG